MTSHLQLLADSDRFAAAVSNIALSRMHALVLGRKAMPASLPGDCLICALSHATVSQPYQ